MFLTLPFPWPSFAGEGEQYRSIATWQRDGHLYTAWLPDTGIRGGSAGKRQGDLHHPGVVVLVQTPIHAGWIRRCYLIILFLSSASWPRRRGYLNLSPPPLWL